MAGQIGSTGRDEMLALHYHPERLLWPGLPQYQASAWAAPSEREKKARSG